MQNMEPERYAFIDVSNTKGTVKSLLSFSIDWQKLLQLLKGEKWQCRDVFYYEGRMENSKSIRKHEKLTQAGYQVRAKTIFCREINRKWLNLFVWIAKKTIVFLENKRYLNAYAAPKKR